MNQIIQLQSAVFTKTLHYAARLVAGFSCIATLFAAQQVFAQAGQKNVLESVTTTSLQSGKVVVKLNFKDALATPPAGFSVTNPARIVLDLPNTTNGMGKANVDVGEGDVRTMSVIEAPSRTRVVLNLARSLSYATVLDGKTLVMTIDTAATVGVAAETITFNAAPVAANAPLRPSVRDIDFRRGLKGEGRVVVELSSATIGIDTRQCRSNDALAIGSAAAIGAGAIGTRFSQRDLVFDAALMQHHYVRTRLPYGEPINRIRRSRHEQHAPGNAWI